MDIWEECSPMLNSTIPELGSESEISSLAVSEMATEPTLAASPDLSTEVEMTSINNNRSAYAPLEHQLPNTSSMDSKTLIKSDCFLDFEPDTKISFATDVESVSMDQERNMDIETVATVIWPVDSDTELAKELSSASEDIAMFEGSLAEDNQVIPLMLSPLPTVNQSDENSEGTDAVLSASVVAELSTENVSLKSLTVPSVENVVVADNLSGFVLSFPDTELDKSDDLLTTYLSEESAIPPVKAEATPPIRAEATPSGVPAAMYDDNPLFDFSSVFSKPEHEKNLTTTSIDQESIKTDVTVLVRTEVNSDSDQSALTVFANGSETKMQAIRENITVSTTGTKIENITVSTTETNRDIPALEESDTRQFGNAINLTLKPTDVPKCVSGAALLAPPTITIRSDSPQLSPLPVAGKHHLPQMLRQAPTYRGSGGGGGNGTQNRCPAVLPLTIKKQDGQSIVIMRQVSSDGVMKGNTSAGGNPVLNLSVDRTVLGATELGKLYI